MQKIPTLFQRDPENRSHVTSEVNPEAAWVLAGEGIPTRKFDGTCVMFDGYRWWARREVKPGKAAPSNYQELSVDPVTGKRMGWEPIEQSAFGKFHAEAVKAYEGTWDNHLAASPGTYELIGPKINGNPENVVSHYLIRHATAQVLSTAPRDFDGLRTWLIEHEGTEGIVWHHLDGRMAKLKRRDFI